MGCLILSIIGIFIGFWLLSFGFNDKTGEVFNVYFGYTTGTLVLLVCGIYILQWIVGKLREQARSEPQNQTPVAASTQQQARYTSQTKQEQSLPLPQSSTSGGVLFVPLPLDEQNRPDER